MIKVICQISPLTSPSTTHKIREVYIVKREAQVEADKAGIFSDKSAVVNHAFG